MIYGDNWNGKLCLNVNSSNKVGTKSVSNKNMNKRTHVMFVAYIQGTHVSISHPRVGQPHLWSNPTKSFFKHIQKRWFILIKFHHISTTFPWYISLLSYNYSIIYTKDTEKEENLPHLIFFSLKFMNHLIWQIFAAEFLFIFILNTITILKESEKGASTKKFISNVTEERISFRFSIFPFFCVSFILWVKAHLFDAYVRSLWYTHTHTHTKIRKS